MKRFLAIILSTMMVYATGAGAEAPGDDWFALPKENVEQALAAEDPLPYFRDALYQHFTNYPLQNLAFLSELNISNGVAKAPSSRTPYGERAVFGKLVHIYTIGDIEPDIDFALDETFRLLYGPWHSKGARTYSTHKNVGWFPWHLDLLEWRWVKVDPFATTMGIRLFHYTDYAENQRTATLAVFLEEAQDHYWCRITIMRKTPER